MKNFFPYLFYRFYSWQLKTWGEGDGPHWSALCLIGVLMFSNFFAITVFLEFFFPDKIVGFFATQKELTLMIASVFMLFGYFSFLHKGKYKKLVKKYDKETPESRKKKGRIMWAYIILSFVVPFSAAFVGGVLRGNY